MEEPNPNINLPAAPIEKNLDEAAQLKAEIIILKAEVAALQKQVSNQAEHTDRGFDVLKWGMGLIITFAIVFAGSNIWVAKTNYEKDRDFLKQQSELSEQRLSLQQKELSELSANQLNMIRGEVETNMLQFASKTEKQMGEFRSEAQTNVSKMITDKSGQLQLAFSNMLTSFTNMSKAVNVEMGENRNQFIKALETFAQTNNSALSNLVSELYVELHKSEALSFSVQGNQYCVGNNGKSLDDLARIGAGVSSYAKAANNWLSAGDESNLEKTLGNINEFFPMLLKTPSTPLGFLSSIDDLNGIGTRIDELILALKRPPQNDRYYKVIYNIDTVNKFFKKLAEEDRLRTFGPKDPSKGSKGTGKSWIRLPPL